VQLIVVGFHRSGTSLMTQLLHRAGLFIGDDLLGAMPSNRFGHFEDREVLELHREILDDNGQGWQVDRPTLLAISAEHWDRMRQFTQKREAAHRLWGFKDPRVSLFLGAWKYLLPQARFVMVYRDPADCVYSLESRHASELLAGTGPEESHRRFFTEPDHGLRLWETYNRQVVGFARAHREHCLVVPFTALTGGAPLVRMTNERFGVGLDEIPTSTVVELDVPTQRVPEQRVLSTVVGERVRRLWADLEALSAATGAW
jgi:hypothetical protein